ncbi:ribosome biogenesis GTPase Der [Terriglobus aquaticus]|uniref:GTPase Der n=1 Tax=Terriglobus aquaticus TaxID=940139 RepID=A0ABW9KNL8_9BACT|nr:ribosome biogenesis GTPase Der [Terriglobus aquaticus]
MAPEKKRLGKKHRSAQTRPHKGATPKGAKPSAGALSGASPKGRKAVAAKKAASFSKGKVRTQSPDRQKGRAVTGAQMAPGALPKEMRPASNRPARGDRGMASSDARKHAATRPEEQAPRRGVHSAALSDPETENALASMLPLIEEAQRPSDSISAPLFAICGRPNVGKSTLFNRLTGTRRSIVGDEPGITRDRIYGEVDWDGRVLRIVDTGGVIPDDEALIPSEIFRQAQVALEEAEAIVMVVDGRSEIAAPDLELSRLLIRSGKPIFLAVNKMDTEKIAPQAENFRTLGFKEVFPISAEHGLGVGDLLDAVSAAMPATEPEEAPELEEVWEDDTETSDDTGEEQPRERKLRSHGEHVSRETSVAIIGRPNVGKSTLLNALTGTGRAIVSPIAGTTRDAVDETVERDGHRFRFVDTAGIRRKGKTTLMAEKLSVIMARKHLEAADVALLVIDATEGVTGLDANIGGYAHESGRSVVIVVNKWDAVTIEREQRIAAGEENVPEPADKKVYTEQVRDALKYLDYAPLLFISAREGINVEEVFKKVQLVARERRKRISTGQMNKFLDGIDFERAGVPWSKRVRIYYMTQAAVAPPTFVLFTDRDVRLHFSYERFLQNLIRDRWKFIGSPIWFKVRPRNKKKED